MTDIFLVTVMAILVTFRLARLISRDTILDNLRIAVNQKASDRNSSWYWIAEWMNCAHCNGIWISFFITIGLSLYFRWNFLLEMLAWLSIAGGQSFLQSLVEKQDDEE